MTQELINSTFQAWKNISCDKLTSQFLSCVSSIDQGVVTVVSTADYTPNVGQIVNGTILVSLGSNGVLNFPTAAQLTSYVQSRSGLSSIDTYNVKVLIINATLSNVTVNMGTGITVNGGGSVATIQPASVSLGNYQKTIILQNTSNFWVAYL